MTASGESEVTADDPRAFAAAVADAVAARNPDVVIALCSGGHDSTAMLLRAATLDAIEIDAIAHCNTGIGIEASRQYVRERAADLGLPYIEGLPPEGDRYIDIVCGKADNEDDRGSGHPGPTSKSHFPVQERLKGRFRDALIRSFEGEVVFLSGARRLESDQRWKNVPAAGIEISTRTGRECVWASPCANWTGSDVTGELRRRECPRNEVRDVLGMSGECLCQAFGSFRQLGDIAALDPAVAHGLWWVMVHVNAWWESFPPDDKPWPRQYLVWGHGGLRDRELREMLGGPLQDPADFETSDGSIDRPDDEQTLDMCATCARGDAGRAR